MKSINGSIDLLLQLVSDNYGYEPDEAIMFIFIALQASEQLILRSAQPPT